jgi:hypothetical protein
MNQHLSLLSDLSPRLLAAAPDAAFGTIADSRVGAPPHNMPVATRPDRIFRLRRQQAAQPGSTTWKKPRNPDALTTVFPKRLESVKSADRDVPSLIWAV